MINYAPLEEEPIVIAKQKKPNTTQECECNTFVMIFIGGVILLALMDTVR